MNIDRHNYEEFFILYLDNELSVADRQLVEDFAAANPDLKAELDLLLQSKLEPETAITFDGKASLLKHEEVAGETASMLLYMDGEMDPAQKRSFEEWIAQHPAAKKEFELFQQTRIQPEHIIFPHKQSLYRQEERRVVAIRWWRMAAAAVLLLGISTSTFMFNQNRERRTQAKIEQQQRDNNALALAKTSSKTNAPVPAQLDAITPAAPETSAEKLNGVQDSSNDMTGQTGQWVKHSDSQQGHISKKTDTGGFTEKTTGEGTTDNGNETAQTFKMNKRDDLSKTLEPTFAVNNNALQADPSLTIQKQINPLPSVTQEEDQPLDIMNEPGRKNRFRGFFRKITRTFEKTTNIKATDGEDRLLVAGLAIKF